MHSVLQCSVGCLLLLTIQDAGTYQLQGPKGLLIGPAWSRVITLQSRLCCPFNHNLHDMISKR